MYEIAYVNSNVCLDILITACMEPPTLSNALTRYTKDEMLGELETNHKNVISSVVTTIGNDVVVGISDLPTRVICCFKNMKSITFEKLKRVYLLGKSIEKMTVLFIVQYLIVEIKKKSNEKPVIVIKKDRPTMANVDAYVNAFLRRSEINPSDERMCSEIVKLFFRWTWGKLAAKIKVKKSGGKYLFEVSNLRSLTYAQLSQLDKVHESVQDIVVNFETKKLHFIVTSSEEYIAQQQTNKKARYE